MTYPPHNYISIAGYSYFFIFFGLTMSALVNFQEGLHFLGDQIFLGLICFPKALSTFEKTIN